MAKISAIHAREILDSNGTPTIEATVTLDDGIVGIASCPSSISTGQYEAVELRDHDESRYNGKGVLNAIDNITSIIAPKLTGMEAADQASIDKIMIELDGTENKNTLGANAMLSVSRAVARAGAQSAKQPLYNYLKTFVKDNVQELHIPTPIFTIMNGGKQAGGNLDFQEVSILPATFKTYSESLQIGTSVYTQLKKILRDNHLSIFIGDEGGFAPTLATNEDALSLLNQAIAAVNLRLGYDIFSGLDIAANNLKVDSKYKIKDKSYALPAKEFMDFFIGLVKKYHILYLEDPLSEDDWEGWSAIPSEIRQQAVVIGDDLIASNPTRLQMAAEKHAVNGMTIKPNQIGTVIETIAVVEMAKAAGIKTVIAYRTGETNDDFIADLAVAVSSEYVKFGAPARGENIAKYNRLLQIEQEITRA